LEFLLEKYFANQSKQLQELKNQTELLKDSFAKLTDGFHFFSQQTFRNPNLPSILES